MRAFRNFWALNAGIRRNENDVSQGDRGSQGGKFLQGVGSQAIAVRQSTLVS